MTINYWIGVTKLLSSLLKTSVPPEHTVRDFVVISYRRKEEMCYLKLPSDFFIGHDFIILISEFMS